MGGRTLPFLVARHYRNTHRGVLSDLRLELTGNSKKGDQEIKINGQAVYISTASYLLLFKFFQAAINNVDRWVSVDDIEVVNKEGIYQAINRLKKEIVGFLPNRAWDEYFENENKQYRLSKNVTGLIYDRPKLVKHENGRIKSIAETLPKTRKLKTKRVQRASRPERK